MVNFAATYLRNYSYFLFSSLNPLVNIGIFMKCSGTTWHKSKERGAVWYHTLMCIVVVVLMTSCN